MGNSANTADTHRPGTNIPRWTGYAAEKLVGRTIKNVRYLSDDEKETLDWDSGSLVIELDDGNSIFPSADDEGNGPGALFTTYDDLPTIPVI